ncbi:MAG: hypothetical protein D6690_17695 [Nitrospirae bacterium]|nr:MAG: hypothetical protein D6690_17695 [Nitrospirota bacterium]
MKTTAGFFVVALSVVVFSAGCETYLKMGQGAGTTSEPAAVESRDATSLTGPNRPASGTFGDTLEACLARIPADASAAQRMLAEDTCRRNAERQRPIELVPGP